MIHFQKVVKKFRRHEVLKGVELTIERGHRVALVGSNGAGKTTLIRCLLGEYTCEGKVTIDGIDPRVNRREVLSKIGFVPQLPPPLKLPVEQKLLIAIALGRDSELLVLDEPAANLDPEARHIFFQLLAEKKDRVAMIISSHRLDEVASLVNRVVEMDQGNIVLDDRVADLVEMSSRLFCRIGLIRPEPAFAKTISEWGFQGVEHGRVWEGLVAGPDRLRFLGVLSRYAALLASIQMDEERELEAVQNG